MKKELIRVIKGKYYVKNEFKELLNQMGIRIGRGSKSIYLICFNEMALENLEAEFTLPEDLVVVMHRFGREERFVHYTKKVDPEMLIRSGLFAKKEGFLGDGIYAIPEEDFICNGIGEQNVTGILRDHQLKTTGFYLGSSMVIFDYTGAYRIVVRGKNRENLVVLLTKSIQEEHIVSVFDETIEYSMA